MIIQYLVKSFLQDYKISYMSEIQYLIKSQFTGLLDIIYKMKIQHPIKSQFTGLLDVI